MGAVCSGYLLLCLLDHALDILFTQPALLRRDGDGLGLASALILGTDLQDTIGINLESHLAMCVGGDELSQ